MNFSQVLFFLVTAVLLSCATGKPQTDKKLDKDATAEEEVVIEDLDSSLDLTEHLRRAPGVSVTGAGANAKIVIRGVSTLKLSTEPLFVVDNQPISGGYKNLYYLINVQDVESIRVIKGAEASYYGVRGGNGVIIFKMK